MINGIEKKFVCLEGSNGVGKTTVLKVLSEKYQLKVSKSVPEWFQKYILDVRKLPSDQEYKLYEAAHIAAIMEKTDNNLWIYDRSIYSTIIRIFYKNAKTVDEVFESILKLDIVPELVLIFRCKKEVCYSRRKKRGDNTIFDENFFEYENAVYDLMLNKMANCFEIDTNQDCLLVTKDVYECILKNLGKVL